MEMEKETKNLLQSQDEWTIPETGVTVYWGRNYIDEDFNLCWKKDPTGKIEKCGNPWNYLSDELMMEIRGKKPSFIPPPYTISVLGIKYLHGNDQARELIADYVGCDCCAVHLRSSENHSITRIYYSSFYFDNDSQTYQVKTREERDGDVDKKEIRRSIYDLEHPNHLQVMNEMLNKHMRENKEELVMTFGMRPVGQWVLSHVPGTDMFVFINDCSF